MEQNPGSNVISSRTLSYDTSFFAPFMRWTECLFLLEAQFQQGWRKALSLLRCGIHNVSCFKETEVLSISSATAKLSPGYCTKRKGRTIPSLTALCWKGNSYTAQSCHCAPGTMPLGWAFQVMPMLLCRVSGLRWPLGKSSAFRCLDQSSFRVRTGGEMQKTLGSHQQVLLYI